MTVFELEFILKEHTVYQVIYLSYNLSVIIVIGTELFICFKIEDILFLTEEVLPCIFFKSLTGNWFHIKAQMSLWTSCGFKVAQSKLSTFQWIMMMSQKSNSSHHPVVDCCYYYLVRTSTPIKVTEMSLFLLRIQKWT